MLAALRGADLLIPSGRPPLGPPGLPAAGRGRGSINDPDGLDRGSRSLLGTLTGGAQLSACPLGRAEAATSPILTRDVVWCMELVAERCSLRAGRVPQRTEVFEPRGRPPRLTPQQSNTTAIRGMRRSESWRPSTASGGPTSARRDRESAWFERPAH